MKVIVIPRVRVRSTRGIFHFLKMRLQFFINYSRTKVFTKKSSRMTTSTKVLIAHVGIKDLITRTKEKYTVNQPIRGQYP